MARDPSKTQRVRQSIQRLDAVVQDVGMVQLRREAWDSLTDNTPTAGGGALISINMEGRPLFTLPAEDWPALRGEIDKLLEIAEIELPPYEVRNNRALGGV